MRTCVIFNPVAKGNKARHFRAQLDTIAATATLKKTTGPNAARQLAANAVAEGFDTIVAAGGDGTLNEVLNGIAAADGLDRVRLGVLPLGTVNVFARELKIPLRVAPAWQTICQGREQRIDLPWADFTNESGPQRLYFAQLAGAGLDARAIELVDWNHKKAIGPLAYVIAGLKALCARKANVTVAANGATATGELVLVGNGRLYGGDYELFPGAALHDGVLEVCVLPRVNWFTLLRCGLPLLVRGKLPDSAVRRLRASEFTLAGDAPAAFEVDGEWAGRLPAKFGVARERLRIIVP